MGTGGLKPYLGVYPVAKDDPEEDHNLAGITRTIQSTGHGTWEQFTPFASNALCEHNWQFLRHRTVTIMPNGVDQLATGTRESDIFYCTKCLAKREVPA